MPAIAPSSRPKLAKLPSETFQDDDDDSDSSSDELAAAFEMDGQELWAQSYCATCDCLIEPGQGLGPKQSAAEETTASTTGKGKEREILAGLKSKSGTIKARWGDGSTGGPAESNNKSRGGEKQGKEQGNAPLKRTHSAGRLHAVGGAGGLGPHKRTGSAASRLNALSELKPTTKLDAGLDKGKGKGRQSPALSRRGSNTSNRSSSGPSSPAKSSGNTSPPATLPRSKKGAVLSALTPAALKEQEDAAAKAKTPAALYCSERCRLIDERRSAGLGGLALYLSQPAVPPPSSVWAPNGWPTSAGGSAVGGWPRSTSVASAPYGLRTPESECMCPECMDKHAEVGSASGTVPSGASDTTESSNGYPYYGGPYGAGTSRQKPRTTSGRIVTPLNLHPPGGGEGYFGAVTALPRRSNSTAPTESPKLRPLTASKAEAAAAAVPSSRTNISATLNATTTGPVGSASTAETEDSAVSSDSARSMWEPTMRRRYASGEQSNSNAEPRSAPNEPLVDRTESMSPSQSGLTLGPSTISRASTETHLTGLTATTEATAMPDDSGQSRVTALQTPSFRRDQHRPSVGSVTPVRNREHRSSVASLGTSFDPMTSPIRLLRPPQPGEPRTHTAAPSVDITAEQARSPLVQSHMPRSMMSDQAELGTSAQTLVSSSASRGRGHGRGHSLSLVPDPGKDVAVSPGFDMPGSQVSGQGTSMSASLSELGALGSLKLAQARAAVAGLAGVREGQVEHHKRADSDAGNIASALGHKDATSRRHSTVGVPASGSGSHWLRTLSSAWASFRGGPSAASASADTPTFEDSPNAGTAASSRRGSVGGPRPTPAAPTGRPRPASTHSGDSLSSRRLSSVSPAGASLAAALAAMDGDGPTPTQSLVVRPSLRRSSMPSFDHDATSRNMARSRSGVDAPSLAAGENVTVTNGEMMSNVDAPSLAAAHEQVEEERRRRRLEKERALRHRRSKDVHILPPLLAPRPSGSNLNLTSPLPPRSARSTSHSHSRTRAGSGAYNVPPMYVGSAGNSAASAMPPPSSHAHVPPSPSHRPNLLRSPRSQTFNPFADGGFSPSRAGLPVPGTPGFWSGPPSAGTSPRRAGLGWGAIPSATHGADSNAHGNSSSLSYGHAAALASHHAHGPYGHAAHGYGQPHGPHGHGHRHHHHHHHSYGTPASARGGLHHYSSQLALGAHPHGHAQVYNRHATMPVLAGYSRSGTPSVPEDGAAMSTEAFLAPSPVHSRPASALGYRSPSVVGPPRPRSVVGMYSSGAPPVPESETSDHPGPLPAPAPRYAPIGGPGLHGNDRTWSWDNLPGLKTYPVLQLPGRETHDRYDEGWGLGEGGLEEVLTGRPKSRAAAPGAAAAAAGSSDPAQGQGQGGTGPGVEPRSGRVEAGREAASRQSTHRKKLFYFDN